nr:hypothetical protein [uncultured Carboxylicivirga sp.]
MLKNIFFWFLITSSISLQSQNKRVIINQTDSIRNFYYSETYNPDDYLNGKEYKAYYNPTTTSPLLEKTLGEGTIFNKGVAYNKLTIAYDRNLDELIVMPGKYVSDNVYVKINKSEVDSFYVNYEKSQYLFINRKSDTVLPKGFYEIPYKGKHELYVKYTTSNLYHDGVLTYYPKIERYLIEEENCFLIKKKKDLLNVFSENKKEVRKKTRSYHTPFKNLTNFQFTQILKFAESL